MTKEKRDAFALLRRLGTVIPLHSCMRIGYAVKRCVTPFVHMAIALSNVRT